MNRVKNVRFKKKEERKKKRAIELTVHKLNPLFDQFEIRFIDSKNGPHGSNIFIA